MRQAGSYGFGIQIEIRLLHFFDDDVFHRYDQHACTAGFDVLDLVDDFLAFGYGAENAVAPAILSRIVEEIIVADVNEELGRRGVRIADVLAIAML